MAIQYKGRTYVDMNDAIDIIGQWYGRNPHVQTIRYWVSTGLLSPIKGGLVDGWDGSNRANLYAIQDINQLRALYERSQGDDLMPAEFCAAVNRISKYTHQLEYIREMLRNGQLPSWRDRMQTGNPYRISRGYIVPVAERLDMAVIPADMRLERFNELMGLLLPVISQNELAKHIGVHVSYLSRCRNSQKAPSLEVLNKIIDVKQSIID